MLAFIGCYGAEIWILSSQYGLIKGSTHLEYFNPFGRALRLGPRVQWIKRQLGDAAPCGGLTKRRAQ